MQAEYDVIIIGSGIGGVASATLLARAGYKTLLMESKERLGGRFSTISHDGFKLPTGAQLIHKDGWIPWLMKEAGVRVEYREFPGYGHGFYLGGGGDRWGKGADERVVEDVVRDVRRFLDEAMPADDRHADPSKVEP